MQKQSIKRSSARVSQIRPVSRRVNVRICSKGHRDDTHITMWDRKTMKLGPAVRIVRVSNPIGVSGVAVATVSDRIVAICSAAFTETIVQS